jgi:hypothetical protein
MGQTYNVDLLNADGTLVSKVGELTYTDSNATTPAALNATSPVGTITAGALPTVTLSSATGAQVSTTRDVNVYVPLASDATNNAATCAVALSPDNTTYTTVATVSVAAAINNLGALTLMKSIRVPAGWYIKLTTSRMTIGAAGVCSYA